MEWMFVDGNTRGYLISDEEFEDILDDSAHGFDILEYDVKKIRNQFKLLKEYLPQMKENDGRIRIQRPHENDW